ncbi:unnamed protein product [Phytophthora lilii]|uniref:Unnamed protein product n=1 Tax=Phytophthora lilii TaxID=2077276 RepID=A0A9W6XDG5_9STRA|nr:unnamed protein product [Phytophthora lilii]
MSDGCVLGFGCYAETCLLDQQALGEKVITREVVRKYYLWKRTTEFKEWRRRQEAKKVKKKKREAELLRQWGDDSDADPETEAFLGYHNAHCELCATGGKLLCCDGCARAYHFSCVQPPITKVPSKDEDWFCSYCQAAFGGPKPKLLPSEDNEYCLVCPPLPDVPRSLIEAVTDASSYEEEDEAEDNSDEEEGDEGSAGSEPNDDVASTNDGDTSDFPSTEDLSPDTGNSGNITDDESENTSSKVPSPSDGGVDNSRSNNDTTPIERKPGELVAPRHQAGAEIQKTGLSVGSSQPAVYTAVPHRSTEPSPVGARRVPPTQLERPGSGRKRHRKTLVPRRIPPSHFDS